MTALNKQAELRQLAEKATKGPWRVFSDIGTETYAIHTPRDKRCGNVIKWAGFDCQKNAKANAEFIAAANPATVLALLDELEESQALVANESACADSTINLAINWQMRCKEAEEKLEAAEKRIAELEAVREVFLRAKALMYQSGGAPIENSLNPIDAWLYDAERAAAGIGVKGE